jgi:hypothetical protein
MSGPSSNGQWGWHLSSRPPPSRKRPSTGAAASSSDAAPKAAPPLRDDAPGRKERRRGELPALRSEEERAAALFTFRTEIYAASTRRVMEHKLSTVTAALGMWGLGLLPPTIESISALGATLKAGHYRSAASYLTLYKGHAERAGYEFTGHLQRSLRDAVRSCERGLGGAVKARALPFELLGTLPSSSTPWTKGGAGGPRQRDRVRFMVADSRI